MAYALEEKDEAQSVWRIMKKGLHASIVEEIVAQAEKTRRLPTVEGVVRMTGRRIGQEMVKMAGGKAAPSLVEDALSVFRLLPPGAASSLASGISSQESIQALLASGDWREAARQAARMTGRAVGPELSLTATRIVRLGVQLAKGA